MAADPKQYERQPEESAPAFAAFVAYRDLGPQRSLDEVGRQLYSPTKEGSKGDQKGRKRAATGHIREWSVKFDWVKRAQLWDAEQDAVLRTAQLSAVQKMAERHAEEAVQLQAKAIASLKTLKPEEMSAADIIRMFVEGVKIERLSRGQPDAVQEQRIEAKPVEDFFAEVKKYVGIFKTLRAEGTNSGTPAGTAGEPTAGPGNGRSAGRDLSEISLEELLAPPQPPCGPT
jgi:hypothetical protein